MASRDIKTYYDNGIEVPAETVGQNAPGGTPKWLYRVQGTYSNDDFTFNLTGRGVSSGVYDTSFIECTASCPVSTVTNRTINDNRIAGVFYLDASLPFNIKAGGRVTQFHLPANNMLDMKRPALTPGPAAGALACMSRGGWGKRVSGRVELR